MERSPAACAMDWSIELEKGLRSQQPSNSIESILQIGPRLERWSREPRLSVVECEMFGLVAGEDRLFANAILLRLADTFKSGDKDVKVCIVKIFLSELRHCRKKRSRRRNDGFFSKCRLDNHIELLRRVKLVFDTGDVEVKALALLLFGCWADFAKDSAEIRYLVLSSLVSSHVLEVKASLFAAKCFCELSYDFASVLSEILVNMVTLSETSIAVRLAGVRAFAKLGSSSLLANRAYKTGLKLLLDSSEEDFSVVMLISLSRIASRSTLLISEQMELLFSFLCQGKTLRLQVTSLRCLRYILGGGVCHFPGSTEAIKTLVSMLNESKFFPALQSEALQILHKIFLYNLPSMPCIDLLEFSIKLLTIVENVIQSPIILERLLAIGFLMDISGKLVRRAEMELDGTGSTLASQVISFAMDRIFLLVKPEVGLHQPDLEMEQEVKSLLNFLFHFIEECPDLCGLVMEKICVLAQKLVNLLDRFMGTGKSDLSSHESVEFRKGNMASILSKLMLYVFKIVVTCLENLKEAHDVTIKVLNTMKLLVECVQRSSLFDFCIHTIYSLLLHSHIICYYMWNSIEEIFIPDGNLCTSLDYFVQQEILTLEFAKKMLGRKDNWSAYKAGKYAACQGAWITAAFIFRQLMTMVQSDSCKSWLKSLALFAHSERKVQLLLLPEGGSSTLNWLENNKLHAVTLGDDLFATGERIACSVKSPDFIENLVWACEVLHSSDETLGASDIGHAFSFQRWFLSERVKFLATVSDILKLLTTDQDGISSSEQVHGSIFVETQKISWSVNSLLSLAREFDLMATSFIGMDKKSSMIISALALSCSLLAFSTGFSVSIPKLHALEGCTVSDMENSEHHLRAMLIQDLIGRLRQTDCDTSRKLWLLMKFCGQPRSYAMLQFGNKISKISREAKGIFRICNFAVTRIVDLHNEANRVHDDESLSQFTNDGLQFLLDIIMKLMHIPFRTPNYFFRARPCVTSELFAMNRDSRSLPDGISVVQGSHLSLNLCLQLKNTPEELQVRLTKLYCILHCKTSCQIPQSSAENKGQTQLGYHDWGIDDMVDLNEKLLRYVKRCPKISSMCTRDKAGDSSGVTTYVCFEPNERGQGFSTSLLDISAFPVGSYRIKWHSCCVDSDGSYYSLPPLNAGLIFTVEESSIVR